MYPSRSRQVPLLGHQKQVLKKSLKLNYSFLSLIDCVVDTAFLVSTMLYLCLYTYVQRCRFSSIGLTFTDSDCITKLYFTVCSLPPALGITPLIHVFSCRLYSHQSFYNRAFTIQAQFIQLVHFPYSPCVDCSRTKNKRKSQATAVHMYIGLYLLENKYFYCYFIIICRYEAC